MIGFQSIRPLYLLVSSLSADFDPWVGTNPWRMEQLPTPVFLPGEFHGQKSLAGYSPRGHKESDMTEQLTLELFIPCSKRSRLFSLPEWSKHVTSSLLLLLSCFSRVRLCATPQTAAHQTPPSLGFSRQEHWSGLPFPSPMHESEK